MSKKIKSYSDKQEMFMDMIKSLGFKFVDVTIDKKKMIKSKKKK